MSYGEGREMMQTCCNNVIYQFIFVYGSAQKPCFHEQRLKVVAR